MIQTPEKPKVLIRANYQLVPVFLEDIIFIKALEDYVIYHTTHGKYITQATMKDTAKNFEETFLKRCHRSFIVNTERIRVIKRGKIFVRGNQWEKTTIPSIGRAYKEKFKAALEAA